MRSSVREAEQVDRRKQKENKERANSRRWREQETIWSPFNSHHSRRCSSP